MTSPVEHPAAPPDTPEAASPRRPDWPLWIAPAAIVVGLALGTVGTIVVDGVGAAGGGSINHPGPAASIIADIVFDLCFVAAALWLAAWRGRPRARDFGYRRIRPVTGIKAFIVAAVVYYGVSAVYSAVFNIHGNEKLPSELGTAHSTPALIAAGVFVCAIAPMAEEFFFRGFVFTVLSRMRLRAGGRDFGPWLAAVLTGILFGLAHTGSASSEYLVPLGFLGFVLCIVRWRTGSLYPCMALHSANNALALGVNQLTWSAPAILGLIVASWLVVGAVTGPLSGSRLAPGRPSPAG